MFALPYFKIIRYLKISKCDILIFHHDERINLSVFPPVNRPLQSPTSNANNLHDGAPHVSVGTIRTAEPSQSSGTTTSR